MTAPRYRHALPQLGETRLLTDGGLETTLIFHDGLDLPHFAAFDLLRSAQGRETLTAYYLRYAGLALERGVGFILDTPTWRASRDWGARMGYAPAALAQANMAAIGLLAPLRDRFDAPRTPFVLSGNIGPRGDGYSAAEQMSPDAAKHYHTDQVTTFERGGVDMVTALTMTHAGEAVGIARAAAAANLPCAIGFTVETDGRLPSGQPLGEAIEEVDALSFAAPAYFMVNCAHPAHFRDVVAGDDPWRLRIRGIRANASRLSHAALDAAETLDAGNPGELRRDHRELMQLLPNLRVFGGCCGTDHRHVDAIAAACCGSVAA